MLRTLSSFACLCLLSWTQPLLGQFTTNGSATSLGNNCYRLTPALTNQGGSAWFNNSIDLNQTFEFYATIFLGCSNGGADGMVFAFQAVNTSVGSAGGGMGYQGINPSLGIEFDTYQNGGSGDPSYDHMALISDGNVSHLGATNLQGPVGIKSNLANMEDCNWHDLHVSWDPVADSLKVYVDCELRIAYQGDIVTNIFNGNPIVFWGFTAGTGALSNLQQFCYSYISYGLDTTICQGDTLGLTVGSGTNYSWAPSAGLNNAASATPLAFPDTTTLYTCTITDQCGFTREEYFQITVNDTVDAFSLGADSSLCPGQTIPYLFSQAGADYLWQNGSTDSTFTINTSGIYWLEIQTGCDTVRDSIDVGMYQVPTVNLGPDLTPCAGDTITLSATNSLAAAYTWQDGSPDSLYEVTNSGLYWVELTHVCGPVRDSVLATFTPQLPVLSLGNDSILCDQLSYPLQPGLAGVNYLWSNNSTAASLTPTQSGLYWLEISNACFSFRDSVDLTFEQTPAIDLGPDTTLCVGDSLLINATFTPTTTYLWQDGLTNPIRNLGGGNFYTLTLNNTCGTATDGILTQSLAPPPSFDLGPDTLICEGEGILLSSGLSGYAYQWQDNSTLPTYSVSQGGIYQLEVSNRCGMSNDSRLINYIAAPEVDLGDDVFLCPSDAIQVDVTWPGSLYSWSDGSTDPIRSLNQAGVYRVVISNSCGVAEDAFEITLGTEPQPFSLGQDQTLCVGDELEWNIEQNGDFQYQWQDGDRLPQKTGDEPGLYWARISNICGEERDSIRLDFVEAVSVYLGADTLMCADRTDRKFLSAYGPEVAAYQWQDGSTGPTLIAEQPGLYTVEVSNACGTALDSIELIPTLCVCAIHAPTAFSPNADGFNDGFVLGYECQIESGTWKVFNRWGQMVFQSNDPTASWDGTQNGRICPEGVYVWVMEFQYMEGDRPQVWQEHGTITLIR
ncbi:MAG: gliding motility-associated C-terminal domain-containing protein [Bacteroidota bacterium]